MSLKKITNDATRAGGLGLLNWVMLRVNTEGIELCILI